MGRAPPSLSGAVGSAREGESTSAREQVGGGSGGFGWRELRIGEQRRNWRETEGGGAGCVGMSNVATTMGLEYKRNLIGVESSVSLASVRGLDDTTPL